MTTNTHPYRSRNAGKAPQLQKTPGRGLLQACIREAAVSATPALHPQPSSFGAHETIRK